MIHSLEKKGIVKRVVNNTDKRSHNLYLSNKGITLKTELLPVVNEAHNYVTRFLSEQEIQNLKIILDKLYASVKEES